MPIDVEPDPNVGSHVIAEAASVGVHVIDSVGRRVGYADAIPVVELLDADVPDEIHGPGDPLRQRTRHAGEQEVGLVDVE